MTRPHRVSAGARVAGPEVDDLQPVRRRRLEDHDKPVSAPHLVFGGAFGRLHFGLYLGAVGAAEFGAEDTFGHFARDPAPGEPQLDRFA